MNISEVAFTVPFQGVIWAHGGRSPVGGGLGQGSRPAMWGQGRLGEAGDSSRGLKSADCTVSHMGSVSDVRMPGGARNPSRLRGPSTSLPWLQSRQGSNFQSVHRGLTPFQVAPAALECFGFSPSRGNSWSKSLIF